MPTKSADWILLKYRSTSLRQLLARTGPHRAGLMMSIVRRRPEVAGRRANGLLAPNRYEIFPGLEGKTEEI